jgi:type II secretory ATPase GspE/PulE/Tfp pilus assembly ATPase PilB-like protein
MKASQTGHLVLSTIHTNDSISAIARLVDLKISSSLIASSVTAIMSQRLVRKLCTCRQQVAATPEYIARLVAAGMEDSEKTMYVPGSCPACDHFGYRGRVGLAEIFVIDDEIRTLIRTDARPDHIRIMARSKGMRTMQEDALDRVKAGLTTFDEILRVISFEDFRGARCSNCSREMPEMFLFCPYCGVKRRSNGVLQGVPVHAGPGGEFA